MKIQHRNALQLAWHLPASLLLIAALLIVCDHLPGIDHATVALLVVAAITFLATVWGRVEALAAAIGGGLGFDYYFLPPRGLGMEKPEHVVALIAFAFVAVAIGHLTSRMKRLLDQRDSLMQLSLEPLCIGDLNGKLQSVNPAMVNLLGWSEQELLEKPLVEFVHTDDRPATLKAIQRAAETGLPVELENRYRTRNGEWRWLHWKLAPPATGTSWQSAAARDITEEKWAQEKLRDLAGQVMTAQEEERRRIARELHDDVTQRLATMGIGIGLLKQHNANSADEETRCELEELQGEVLQLSKDVRDLSHSLHPSLLEHSDLATNLEMYCREFAQQSGIRTDFAARNVPSEIPKPVAVAIYRIAQESLRNVSRHANASQVSVVLVGESNGVSLTVMDNGHGFDINKARVRPGLGLVSIEERARQASGELSIESVEGAGTTLRVLVPLAGAAD